mmetsp:Transcript_87723/g.263776  ORF Transcript_87723/g.263776 Transcript_87723/m.263776 type:complete len:112 (+) Transcript_87723:14-349(+)
MWSHLARSLHDSTLAMWSRRPDMLGALRGLRDRYRLVIGAAIRCTEELVEHRKPIDRDFLVTKERELLVLESPKTELSSFASSLAPGLRGLQYTLTVKWRFGSLKLAAPCR